ncbi:Protein CBG18451 [Caenorhabditis briggsae]|uniref:Protein CBG18451 n=1 Tax=Caenorhabditis briggsae TaxID=6238 RepID=A8XTC4_CAEBR|nr:Protein CBG18451 [Caenorhabditis briggsae]CAP35901.1 Protein CBG18451 [Caenorhabditis briggsae]
MQQSTIQPLQFATTRWLVSDGWREKVLLFYKPRYGHLKFWRDADTLCLSAALRRPRRRRKWECLVVCVSPKLQMTVSRLIDELESCEPTNIADHVDVYFAKNDAWGVVSRNLLTTVSPYFTHLLDDNPHNRLQLDTKWADFRLLLDVFTNHCELTADNVKLVAEQSKKYKSIQVDRMVEEFYKVCKNRLSIF